MRKIIKSALFLITGLLLVFSVNPAQKALAGSTTVKPLWKSGQYFGGYPTIDKYLTQGITFRISPDKKTMKDISIEFPADFHDENGVITPRSIHFSPVGIEPITLRRTDRTQSHYFAYLDSFNNNWNTELRITWSRNKQSFKIVINSQSDPVENTFYKASATVAKGAVRRRIPGS